MSKIVIVAPGELPIPPVRGGSVQIYLYHLIRHLKAEVAMDVKVMCPGSNAPLDQDLIAIPASRSDYQRAVLQRLRKLRPSVIQIDNRPSFVSAVRKQHPKAKIILNLHSTTFLGPRHIRKDAVGKVLSACDAVVVNSHYLKREIRRRFQAQNRAWNVRVIYPGVDLSEFRHDIVERNHPHTPLRLLYVGRVIEQKGVHVIVETVRELTINGFPVQLTIIGRTHPWERAYEKRLHLKAKGLPVVFAGFVPNEELSSHYHDADVFLCPSQRDEAFGMVNIEAMASGLPVIASAVGGITETVAENCGILVKDYTNPRAFLDAIVQLTSDHARYTLHCKNAVQRALQFTWSHTARQFANLYTELQGRSL